MSTFDYDDARKTALELLKEFGNDLTLNREESGGIFDPVSGTITGGSTLILNGTGVLLNFTKSEVGSDIGSGSSVTNVRSTDRKLLYQGDALEIGDLFNGWRIHNFMNLDPDESGTILITAQMRK